MHLVFDYILIVNSLDLDLKHSSIFSFEQLHSQISSHDQ